MEKNYFLQRRCTNNIYHFNLSSYDKNCNYANVISMILGYTPNASNNACYDYLVYLLATYSGYNKRNTIYRGLKVILSREYKDLFRLKSDLDFLAMSFKYIGSSAQVLTIK